MQVYVEGTNKQPQPMPLWLPTPSISDTHAIWDTNSNACSKINSFIVRGNIEVFVNNTDLGESASNYLNYFLLTVLSL